MFRKYIESTNQLIISNSICEKIILFSLFSSLRALHRMRAKFPHVARAEDRRPSWRLYGLRNFDFVALTGKKMQLYVRTSRAALALRVCVSSYTTNTYVLTIYVYAHTSTGRSAWNGKPRVQVMNSTWVTTRFSSHARASWARANFSRHSTDVNEWHVRMILSQQQHFRIDLT